MDYNQLVSQLKDAAINYSLALNKTRQDLTHDEMKKAREQVNSSHSYLVESAIKFGDYVNNSVPARTLTDCIGRMLKSSDYEHEQQELAVDKTETLRWGNELLEDLIVDGLQTTKFPSHILRTLDQKECAMEGCSNPVAAYGLATCLDHMSFDSKF